MREAWAAGEGGPIRAGNQRLVPAWKAASRKFREQTVRQSLQPEEAVLASGGCYFRPHGFSVSHHQGWVVVTDRRLLVFLARAGYTRFPGWMYFTGILFGVLAYLVLVPGRPPRLVAEYQRVHVEGLWRPGGRWVGGGGDLLLKDGNKPLRFTRLRRGKSIERALSGSPAQAAGLSVLPPPPHTPSKFRWRAGN